MRKGPDLRQRRPDRAKVSAAPGRGRVSSGSPTRNSRRETPVPRACTRILLADDHELFREGVKLLLRPHPHLEIEYEASEVCALTPLLSKGDWDLLILEPNFAPGDGLKILREVVSLAAPRPVLVLTVHPEDRFGLRALQAGARGYLCKSASAADLVAAIETLASGGRYVGEALGKTLARFMESGGRDPHERLSERELQVFRRLTEGCTNKAIARTLHLSAKTVSTYRTRILRKLDLENTVQLVEYAIRHECFRPREST